MSVITIPKELTRLEKRLRQALREVRSGKTVGPFSTTTEGLRFLKRRA